MVKIEEWKPVTNYEGLYEVSDWGRVKSLCRGKERILMPQNGGNGYLHVLLYRKGNGKQCLVHRLVWETFKYRIPEGMEIDHINTVRDDNRLDNLRCTTRKENHANPITVKNSIEAKRRLAQDPEWRKNVSEANRRKTQDPNWRKNVAEAAKKRAQDPEWLRKNAEAAKRRAQDPEWKKNHAEAMKRAKGKPVNQYTLDGVLVKTWSSEREAAKELGIHQANISKCCKGELNKTGGFRWRHIQEKEAV